MAKQIHEQDCCREKKSYSMYYLIGILLLTCCLIFISRQGHAQGKWTKLVNTTSDNNYGVMLLLTDGTVMIKTSEGGGGADYYGNTWEQLTPDTTGSYVNGTFSYLSPMTDTRLYFSTQVLNDGRVYVAGGEYGSGKATTEVYDPTTDSWTKAPTLPRGDSMLDANSEILPDGRVLQAVVIDPSGYYGYKNFIYDPVANTYTAAPSSIGSHEESTWVKLPDNSTLFVDFTKKTSERYIPSLSMWVKDDTLPLPIYDTVSDETGPAFLLPDGRAIFFGANGNTAYYTPSGDTAKGSWKAGPKIPFKRGSPDGCAAMMNNGKILISVSDTPSFLDWFPSPTVFYEFNYLNDSFTEVAPPVGVDTLRGPCFDTHFVNLPDGGILFSFGTANYYEYMPDSTPLAVGKPAISNVMKVDCNTYTATGTLFNGITEGSVYGDDWQMSTNYPIVRLTNAAGTVFYARTTNWNRIGAVMTGSLPDTTQFTLPVGLPDNTYSLQVIANGNPSDGVPFSTCGVTKVATVPVMDTKVYVYPNPATSQATVVFSSTQGGQYNIKLLNILGQVMSEETANAISGQNEHMLNLAGMTKGIYTVVVKDGVGVYNTKLVVE